ncbi:MAG TPA: hypothetical protein IAC04_06980 [Candidatus Coprenecus stercoravium]|uniref:Uncharacterized protein n=1 Tax=Candidatus Coprenecus stercoravium TaxID=2840735 RepID=A0A9D2GRF9_9BACT|nr:hypothetical protein [Candidatus Coprenecus stercoravium]
MRKLLGICLTAVLSVLSVWSCKVDESERDGVNPVLEEGFLIYSVTAAQVLSPVLATLDVALKVDSYLEADSVGRYDIEDRYFPSYRLRLYDDRCLMTGVVSEELNEVIFDSLSIFDTGASWRSCVNGVHSVVTCTAPGEWDVDMDLLRTSLNHIYALDSISMHVSLEKETDTSYVMYGDQYVYTVVTSGSYIEKDPSVKENVIVRVGFETAGQIDAVLSQGIAYFHFFNGGLNMHMDMTGDMERSEDVEVVLSPAVKGTIASIEYMGKTDYWTFNEI